MTKNRRWLIVAASVLITLPVATYFTYRFALNELRTQVIAALGDNSEVGEIELSFRAIHLRGLKIKAPANWPAKYALSAEHVIIVPEIAAVLSGTILISQLQIERAYAAVLRDENGKLHVAPSLTEKKLVVPKNPASPGAGKSNATALVIDKLSLKDCAVSFFDAGIASPPLEVKMTGVNADIGNLHMPGLLEKSAIDMAGKISGTGEAGQIHISGWMVFGNRDSEIKTTLRDVDVTTLEPYLIRKAETGVRSGTLDLDLDSTVSAQRVTAPGTLKLKQLQLRADGNGGVGTFMGIPRDTLVDMLRERDGAITIPFKLEGSLNDPRFSLDNAFKARLGIAAATTLGLAVRDLLDAYRKKDDGTADSNDKKDKVGKTLDLLKGLLRR